MPLDVDLPPLPFLPSAEERIKMVRWGTEIALAERERGAQEAPAGWKLVPVQPTEEMLLNAHSWIAHYSDWKATAGEVYAAMLAAAIRKGG